MGIVHPRYRQQLGWDERVNKVLNIVGKDVQCLGKNKDGTPRHPSRLSYNTERVPFWKLNSRV